MGVAPRDHVESPVAWREAGSGPPILFLHGLGGTRLAWEAQLRDLGDRFRCVAWDMPGYGDSQPVEPLTFAAIADRVVLLLDQLDIARADLVGLSFGGMHALHTAIHHPDRVGRLVLADTSPAFGLDGTTAEPWIASRLGPIAAGDEPGDAAEAIIDAITAAPLRGRLRAETVAAFRSIPTAGFEAAVRCLPGHDVRADLPSIDNPACVIVGEHDRETPVAYARALAEGLPNAELHVIDGVGHLTPAEAPDRFSTIVAEFLAHDHRRDQHGEHEQP